MFGKEESHYYVWWDDNGMEHREDGPSVVAKDGSCKFWHHHGKLHREDGPAVEYADGINSRWYYYGKKINCSSQQEFEKLIKLKSFW